MIVRNVSCLIAILTILFVPTNAQEKTYSAHDLNELMARVWQNCRIDLDNLRGYIFNETESAYVKKWRPYSSSRANVQDRFDWVWIVKDGYLGPILKSINGKEIPVNGKTIKITKKQYSLTWKPTNVEHYMNERQNLPKWEKWDTILDFFDDEVAVPRWNERVFPQFDYRPREYTYVGSREYEGHRVIEITYPSYSAYRSLEIILVKMLVIPDDNQLIAVTLSIDGQAQGNGWKSEWTMTMDNSHDNVWLPKNAKLSGTSSWGGEERATREFNSYARTGVKAKFWFEDVRTRIWFGQEKPEATK